MHNMKNKRLKKHTPHSHNTDAQNAYNEDMSEEVSNPQQKDSEKKSKRHICVATGIYRHVREGTYHERPIIDGKRTWRSLGVNFAPQRNGVAATREYHRRRTMEDEGKNPYAQPTESKAPKKIEQATTVGEIIRRYQKDGYLDRDLLKRPASTEAEEARHCATLLEFWDDVLVEDVRDKICDDYRDERVKNVRQGEGLRTVDRELNTLNNAFRYCKRRDFIRFNPITDRPKYQPSSRVHHCREFCPLDADELHESAAVLFEHRNTVVLGFQLLAEAYSGLRTSEVLRWGVEKFGTPSQDEEHIHVWRLKGQHLVNPYCYNHEGMQALLQAHAAWKQANYPDASVFFPSHCGGVVGKGALAHRLDRLHKAGRIKRKLTSHGGGRAFYVLIRRSQGIKDEVIAFEIGHTSGGQCIKTTYGGVPPNWQNGKAPNLSWLPIKVPLAWASLEKSGWKFIQPKPELQTAA